MTQKTILITGCSSGIGLCCAQGLHARSYRVFTTARKAEDVNKLQALGLEALLLELTDSVSIHAAVDEVLRRTGGTLDALFNNAGYGQAGAVEDIGRDVVRTQFETNLFGPLELTNRIIPVMRRQGHGRIIQNSSLLGLSALPYRGAYNASKFAIEGLTDTLRLELHGTGIHVSIIEPGPIISRFRANSYAMFKKHINAAHSPHRTYYEAVERRLLKPGPVAPFTLPPEAVLKRLIHALESPRPRPRYYVTAPTYFFGIMRRLLSSRALDRVIRTVAGDGQR